MSSASHYMLDNGNELTCLQVMRSLPGKRLVFAGEYQGNKVVAKLYLDPKRDERHWRRERDGLDVFTECGIATADLLYAGKTEPDGHPVIVLRQLEGLKSVRQEWEAADGQAKEQLLKRMVALIAHHHQAGLCQTDMHLDNFMLSAEEIFSLDGAGVEFYPDGISEEASLDNLALFIAQLTPEWESRVTDIYNLYVSERGWEEGAGDRLLLGKVHEARGLRWKKFRNKLLRNCTAFSYTKYSDGFQVVSNEHSTRELIELLQDPDASFPGKGHALKNGNTCTVWSASAAGFDLVVKRYNTKNIWHGLRHRFVPGRGERSWVNGHRLGFYGISTPRPIALVKRSRGLFPTTYLITEQVQSVSARDWFRDSAISDEDKEFMAMQIAEMLNSLWRQKISHGDLKASNILIVDGKPMLIDLDAMRRHRCILRFNWFQNSDMQRFLANWKGDRYLCQLFVNSLKFNGMGSS